MIISRLAYIPKYHPLSKFTCSLYNTTSSKNDSGPQRSLLFFFASTFTFGGILLVGYSWFILNHNNILPDKLNQRKIIEKFPLYDKLNAYKDRWNTLRYEIPILSRYYKRNKIEETDDLSDLFAREDLQNHIDTAYDIKNTHLDQIKEIVEPQDDILAQNDPLTQVMVHTVLQEREEFLRKLYLKELEREKDILKSKYEHDVNDALYTQGQLLKSHWEAELQEKLDNERQGRLSRIEELGTKLDNLKERLDNERFSNQFYQILQDVQLSIWSMQSVINNENSIHDIIADNEKLEDFMDSGNPASLLPLVQVQDNLKTANQMIYNSWYEKRESNRRILEQESTNLNRLVIKLRDFVEIQVNSRANPGHYSRFKPTLDILESVLPLSIKEEVFFEPVATIQELDLELKEMSGWLCTSATVLPFTSYLSHLISYVVSKLEFSKKGLVPGKDIRAVLSRAKYWLDTRTDLDMATRELANVNDYWPRLILTDWLKKSQKRLTIQQALKVIQSEILLCFGSTQQ